MDEKLTITFSNNEKLILTRDSIIFPLALTEHNGDKFTSSLAPVELGDFYHVHHGLVPIVTEILTKSDFFTVDIDNTYEARVYNSKAVVYMEH